MPLLILPPGRENFTTSFVRISAIADGAYGRRGLDEKGRTECFFSEHPKESLLPSRLDTWPTLTRVMPFYKRIRELRTKAAFAYVYLPEVLLRFHSSVCWADCCTCSNVESDAEIRVV